MEAVDTALPLQRYRLFDSHDVDEARENVARIFCPHRLDLLQRERELDACHHSVRLHRDVSLNYVQYGPAVQIEPGYLKDFFLLQMPLRGAAEIRCGTQAIDATPQLASLPSPTEPLSMRWADDSPHLIVRFGRAALQAQLEALLQAPVREPLVFALGVALDSPAIAPLANYIDCLRRTLDAGCTTLLMGRLAEQAEAHLMSCLLMSAAHNHSAALAEGTQRHVLPRVVRRAQEFMVAHAAEPLALADVCRQVGCSARSLQLAFRRCTGRGPMEFLRDVRLDRVRAELQGTGGSAAPSVGEVAARYGFLHLGHLAAHYRSRFGERPSETRARGTGAG